MLQKNRYITFFNKVKIDNKWLWGGGGDFQYFKIWVEVVQDEVVKAVQNQVHQPLEYI